ncbi:transposase family protein [Methylobacterium sp. NPDC080182]|uniref:transposase family protein n=1 Tax=Methylobacterium sp. NPDC080182 TaxID=3390590 RepID=UPI003CFBE84B
MILSSSLPGCTVERVIRSDGRLVVFAHARRVHGRCPTCGTTSSAVHSRYERRPADLPSVGQPMTLRLRIRRFYCHDRPRSHPAGC